MIFCLSANGQFGASIKYNNNGFSDWNSNYTSELQFTEDVFNTGLEAGVDYWLRLKNHRIEFFPEFSYAVSSGESDLPSISNINFQQFGLNINTHFYLLDFEGDCDCPTWSKGGGFMKKGFFLMLSPGVNFNQFELKGESFEYSNNHFTYKIGLGAGIDFGINNLITITPFVMYNYYPSVMNNTFNTYIDNFTINEGPTRDEKTSNGQLQLGFRIGFRPDYKY